mgnify:CR=1 FL=1
MKFDVKTRPEHITWTAMRDIWLAADDIEIFRRNLATRFFPGFADRRLRDLLATIKMAGRHSVVPIFIAGVEPAQQEDLFSPEQEKVDGADKRKPWSSHGRARPAPAWRSPPG